MSSRSTLTHRDMDVILDYYLNHFVLEEVRSTIVESDCSYVDGYIWWFLRVSHPYMIHDSPEYPLRLTHQKILEEKQAMEDHVIDVLPICHRIVEIL